MSPDFKLLTTLATLLHLEHCKRSHDNDCGWYYETDLFAPWERGMAHNHWLQKAGRVASKNPELTLTEVQGIASQYAKALQAIRGWSE